VFRVDKATEVAPPTYYLLLHFWIRALGTDSVWTMRLLSVFAGIALVAAVWWLALLLAGPGAAFVAALLTALSPLVVQYAQEVRAYIFVMLAATVAVAAAIQATSAPSHRSRWLALSAAASVATIWLHYTGLLVIVAVAIFVWKSSAFDSTARRGYLACCLVALAIVAPLMVFQLRAGHQGGVAPFAKPTATNLLRVIGTPFDGRFPPLAAAYIAGTLAILVAVGLAAASPRTRATPERLLVLAAAVIPVVAVLVVNVAAKVLDEHTYYSLITRYTAVAAPFMLVVLAWTLFEIPRIAAVALGALTALALIVGLNATYSAQSLQPDLRGALARVESGYRAGDTVVFTGQASHAYDPDYYLAQLRTARPGAAIIRTPASIVAVPAAGQRIWVISDTGSAPLLAAALSRAGWHPISTSELAPAVELVLATR
jgi:mannosyltransferase